MDYGAPTIKKVAKNTLGMSIGCVGGARRSKLRSR